MCFDAIGDIGGAMIQGNAEESAQNQASNEQSALQGQSIQTQLDYENTMQNALRSAIGGVTAGGNPFTEAASSGRAPTSMAPAAGAFGPGASGPLQTQTLPIQTQTTPVPAPAPAPQPSVSPGTRRSPLSAGLTGAAA